MKRNWDFKAWRTWRSALRPLFDLAYPRSCSLCNRTIIEPNRESLCVVCDEALLETECGCVRCGAPVHRSTLSSKSRKKRCSYCEKRRWHFRTAYCYTAYHGIASKAAKRMKLPSHEPLAMEIGSRIATWLIETNPDSVDCYDFVIPVPQHWIRRMTIRYNQAEVLAEQIAKSLEIPMRRRWLYRTRWTEKQGTKSIQQRLHSVSNSFSSRSIKAIHHSHILLVDDIVTSGATASDAARALRAAGAKLVDVVAFARGVGAISKKAKTVSPSE